VELMLKDLRERLQERGLGLELTEAAKAALVREGYDPNFGARPLRRTIERRIANPLALQVLAGQFQEGDTVLVDYRDGQYTFQKALATATP